MCEEKRESNCLGTTREFDKAERRRVTLHWKVRASFECYVKEKERRIDLVSE